MRRFIPSKIQEEAHFFKFLTMKDFGVLLIALVLAALILASSMPMIVKVILTVLVVGFFYVGVLNFDMVKGYKLYLYFIEYLTRKKQFKNVDVEGELNIEYGNTIKVGNFHSAVIELRGIDFGILEERTQDEFISLFSEAMKEIRNGKIIKLEKPLDLTKFIDYNDSLINEFFQRSLSEDVDPQQRKALEARCKLLDLQNDQLNFVNYEQRMFVESFYLVICDNEENLVLETYREVEGALANIGLEPRLLKAEELRVFVKLFFTNNLSGFDEKEELRAGLPRKKKEGGSGFGAIVGRKVDAAKNVSVEGNPQSKEENPISDAADAAKMEFPEEPNNIFLSEIKEGSTKLTVNGDEMKVLCLGKYPYFVGNAWAHEIFSIDGVKVVFNFCNETRKNLNVRISKSMQELRVRLRDKKIRDDERLNITTSYQSLEALLEQLEYGGEKLHNTECYLIYPKSKHKEVVKKVKSIGVKINDLIFTQFDGWVSAMPFLPMPTKFNKERQSTIQSSSLAGTFPFVSKQMFDDEGYYLGASIKYPVFFNQFMLTNERVNHNMVILGKSGGGKSFFSKKTDERFALTDKRIFILDPDNEYRLLCDNLHGNWIDVGGDKSGRINPLQVFVSMRGEGAETTGDVTAHRLFLNQFFRVVCPEMPEEIRLFLDKCLGDLYRKFEINDYKNLKTLTPNDYPLFDDLLELINDLQTEEKDESNKLIYRKLSMYIEQFAGSSEGIFSRLWNGPTTLEIHNDFNVLNFQSLFANANNSVANGQMLLLMRFLNQEVIRNRDMNEALGTKKGIVISVDEAHRFINPTFPVALDFMSTMAKQIRKYRGALIVATQNIADFIGVSEEMRAKASSVINACQYSMIFSLFADDVNKVKDLYANVNGGLTETEIDFITKAKRGNALFIVDSNTRMQVRIEMYDGEVQYIDKVS